MKAEPLSTGKILSERQRFIVPIYQRTYSWTKKEQLEPFFDQLESKAEGRLNGAHSGFSHYMGALLLIPEGEVVFGRIQSFYVVDGQQRLTTFHLLFAALRDVAREYKFESLSRSISDLLLHSEQVPMQDPRRERFKLQPSSYDRQLFQDIIDLRWSELIEKYPQYFYKNQKLRPESPAPLTAFWYFWERIKAFIFDSESEIHPAEKTVSNPNLVRLEVLTTSLFEDFKLIVITLSKDDDAQVIFETLNSGGKPLAAMDLVRNDVFNRANRRGEDIESLMENHWSVFEQAFWKQEQTQGRIKKPRIDFFLAHVLSSECGRVIQLSELYSEYKTFISERNFADSISELKTLTQYVPTYETLVNPPSSGILARLARRLSVFDVTTAYPAVFVIAASNCDDSIKMELFNYIASYVIRRALCGLTAKNYNRVFIELASYIKQTGASRDSFAKAFTDRKLTGEATKFPTDADLRLAIKTRNQYGNIPSYRLKLLFEEMEFASRDKFNIDGTLQEGLTIEHIMPQEWPDNWLLPNGKPAPKNKLASEQEMMEQIAARENVIHTLGNLTLLTPPANSSAGHAGFGEKRERLTASLLRLNSEIAELPTWSEVEVSNRADKLVNLALQLWPYPKAAAEAATAI